MEAKSGWPIAEGEDAECTSLTALRDKMKCEQSIGEEMRSGRKEGT